MVHEDEPAVVAFLVLLPGADGLGRRPEWALVRQGPTPVVDQAHRPPEEGPGMQRQRVRPRGPSTTAPRWKLADQRHKEAAVRAHAARARLSSPTVSVRASG